MLTTALRNLVRQTSGLDLNGPTVTRAARQRMAALGIDGLAGYLARLGSDSEELAALLELLVVPETWLFRDPQAFAAAASAALLRDGRRSTDPADPAQPARPLRLLSLPCATGEEPYSLVMALLDAGMPAGRFTVEAIDISQAALARARTGLYRQNAFRNEDLGFRDRYFSPHEGGYLIDAAVRSKVHFAHGNLLAMAPALAGRRYDIIFCRNLLIYFDEPTQQRAIGILDGLLEDDGLLFAGYAELPVFSANGFATAHLRRAFALRKSAAIQAGARLAAAMPAPVPDEVPRANPARAGKPQAGPPALLAVTASPAAARPATPTPVGSDAGARLLAQARALADRGELLEAAQRLDAGLLATPDSAPAYAMRGAVHAALGEAAQAEQCLRRALYLDPRQYDVICQLAVLAERQGDAAGARTLRARAARIHARQTAADAGADVAAASPRSRTGH